MVNIYVIQGWLNYVNMVNIYVTQGWLNCYWFNNVKPVITLGYREGIEKNSHFYSRTVK